MKENVKMLHLKTPLIYSPHLSKKVSTKDKEKRVWLKMEAAQSTGSFKLRGLGHAAKKAVSKGSKCLVASSGGNAGIAVAYAAKRLGVSSTIVVPVTASKRAREEMLAYGATVHEYGRSPKEAHDFAHENLTGSCAYLHPFDNSDVWEGNSSLIDEIKEDGINPDGIILSVGGGGLFAGVVSGLHRNYSSSTLPRLILAETLGADSFAQSYAAKKLITLPEITSIATTLGALRVADHALEVGLAYKDLVSVVVSDQTAVESSLSFAKDHRVVTEAACGAALSLLYENELYSHLHDLSEIVVIVCGGASSSYEDLLRLKENLSRKNLVINSYLNKLSPYVPPLEGREESGALLLDFNERSTPLPTSVLEEFAKNVNKISPHRYPSYGKIKLELAEYFGCEEEEVTFTNGSDQGIELFYRVTTVGGDKVIVPEPTFAMLTHAAEVLNLQILSPHYTVSEGYPFSAVKTLLKEEVGVRGVVVCNPNSPTGTLLPISKIEELVVTNQKVAFLIDECYFNFAKETAIPLVKKYHNLFITRTFSKVHGIAATRFGAIMSAKENIMAVEKVRGPYDVNMYGVAAVRAVLHGKDEIDFYVREVMEESLPLMEKFLKEEKLDFWPTYGNFILIKPPKRGSKPLGEFLKDLNILVRPRSGPGINGTVRITLGTKEETIRVIDGIKKYLEFNA
jgi:histidinol-phosphate aminotransferase